MYAAKLSEKKDFYINGQWRAPLQSRTIDVINPATEEAYAIVSAGTPGDIDLAVAAARAAFESWSQTSREERLIYLDKIAEIYSRRMEEMAEAITTEMGAPIKLAREAQASVGLSHIKAFIRAFKAHHFENVPDKTSPNQKIVHEPIGVCGLITPS
jgi:aldehyde dehydrogenase (NAD+)